MKYIKKELHSKKDYKKAPFSDVHWRVYISILLGQIACGYALGISGIALDQAGSYLPLTNFWTGLIGAGGLIGLFGSIWRNSHRETKSGDKHPSYRRYKDFEVD